MNIQIFVNLMLNFDNFDSVNKALYLIQITSKDIVLFKKERIHLLIE